MPIQRQAFWVSPLYFLVMSFTFLVTVAIDVALGLQLGLALSVTMLLFRLASLERHAMGQLPHGDNSQCFVPLDRYPQAVERPGIKVFRLTGYLWFGNATKMRDQVRSCSSSPLFVRAFVRTPMCVCAACWSGRSGRVCHAVSTRTTTH